MLLVPKDSVSNLSIHLIFVVKYRKKLLIPFGEEIKQLLLERASMSNKFEIESIEVDEDHVHMLINMSPHETVKNIVKQLKSHTVYHIWDRHPELKDQFWKKRMFWSNGYYVSSVGEADRETVRKYINQQGYKRQIHPRS